MLMIVWKELESSSQNVELIPIIVKNCRKSTNNTGWKSLDSRLRGND